MRACVHHIGNAADFAAAPQNNAHFESAAGTMPHDTPLIATIVAGLGLAFIFGALANRFKVPPLVGYLVAGVLVGPNTPGFVADQELALELAEIGVILLMFGVGLHFSLKDLLSVRAIAMPGAIVQIAFATLLGIGLGMLGWSFGAGWSSAWRCRSPRPSCFCARCRSGA
jgi:Kef-type K+ transport system membrane component KefB